MRQQFSILFDSSNNNVRIEAFGQYSARYVRMDLDGWMLSTMSISELIKSLGGSIGTRERQEKTSAGVIVDGNCNGYRKKIIIPDRNGIHYIFVHTILFFEADRSYTTIYLTNGKKHVVSNKSLNEYEHLLEGCSFYRTHRSYLVNMAHVESYIRNGSIHLKMPGGYNIPVARRKKRELELAIEIHD
ncbi:MAG: LytTR family DNA-binding domain-containing protein [Bacteroidetes bacterium]|nr:LytTR family DNA-binding domain-containing protein [Bacteroidota bacterium]